MSLTYYVIHDEEPGMSTSQIGGGSTYPPIAVTINGAGSTDISTIPVKPGADITVEIWAGAGGGGGGSTGTQPGGGGRGGTYAAFLVPAALWASGGSLVLGAGGSGGAATNPGSNGGQSTLTIDGDLLATIEGGSRGAEPGAPPYNAFTSVVDPSLTTLAIRVGATPTTPVGNGPGTAGTAGAGPGGGAGGAGGVDDSGSVGVAPGGGGGGGGVGGAAAGAAGGAPRVRVSFQV